MFLPVGRGLRAAPRVLIGRAGRRVLLQGGERRFRVALPQEHDKKDEKKGIHAPSYAAGKTGVPCIR